MHGKQSFVIIALSGIMGKRKTEGGTGEEKAGSRVRQKTDGKAKKYQNKAKKLVKNI